MKQDKFDKTTQSSSKETKVNNQKARKSDQQPDPKQAFHIQGGVSLEGTQMVPQDLALKAYAFRQGGDFLGSAPVSPEGKFDLQPMLKQVEDVEVYVGPDVSDPQEIRRSSAFEQHFSAKDWLGEGSQFQLRPNFQIGRDIWVPWWPVRLCISGHVRKVEVQDGSLTICPVPFVKVEIFDVDRESCWWPYIVRDLSSLLDRKVVRVPDLLRELPIPIPEPDPDPFRVPLNGLNLGGLSRVQAAGLQARAAQLTPGATAGFDPQPEPPAGLTLADLRLDSQGFRRVGEVANINPQLAARLDDLTLTSRIAPWLIFPHCFYSQAEICETTTDCEGYFRCCFRWWPFHFRRGRLRFDGRPDIIVRVTQVINGVQTVIYMDPYTNTRWDSGSAHIDLFLDNEEVVCGSDDCQPRPAGPAVFFTRIGADEVYKINQSSGLYAEGALSNVAYGTDLDLYAQFGDDLSDGSPARYYRLSYAKKPNPVVNPPDAAFTPIPAPPGGFYDTRVSKVGLVSQTHFLGPKPVGSQTGLYEVRNFSDFYWYNPDWIGTWYTSLAEEDTGLYVLRLEVFDENGNKLNTSSGLVDYRDGTVTPPAVLPPMTDHCDLVLTLDNKAPELDIQVPATNECGVIPWSLGMVLNLGVSASQANGRLHSVEFVYSKGVNPTEHTLYSHVSNNGAPGSINVPVSGAALLVGLDSTCAFALELNVTAHIRNGRNFVYYRQQDKAIAIEKCS
jgi:hypothetical protein